MADKNSTVSSKLSKQKQSQADNASQQQKKPSSSASSVISCSASSSTSLSTTNFTSVSGRVAPSTTTTALNSKLSKLTEQLQKERQARVHAQQQLKKTCAELEALEAVLHLRPPENKKKTFPLSSSTAAY